MARTVASRARKAGQAGRGEVGAAHDAVDALWPIAPLTLIGGPRSPWLTLWDEARGRLVSFREAARTAAA